MNDEVARRLVELSDELSQSDAAERAEIESALVAFHEDGNHQALGERLHDWVLRLESSHPQMSRIMARVLDAMPGV
ncbi:MAG: DUF4404 family protein [Acidimicrobiia bacterium]|nr:DUF4404 family protein [Acidimicrobiia bacterium]